MKRTGWWLAGLVAIFGSASAQETQVEKDELRYKFEKGGKYTLKLKQKTQLKLTQIPDQFKEMIGDEPFSLELTGTLALEVKEVKDDGSATFEGKFQKMKATGTVFIQDVSYEYDAEKPPKKDEDEGDGGQNPLGMDPTAMLKQLATTPLNFTMDALGKLTISGGGQQNQMLTQLLSFNGLMGALPKEKVGVGDKWKANDSLTIPGVNQMKVNLKSENTYEKKETVGDVECAVIKSKFTVGTTADEGGKDDGSDQGSMFNLKTKMTGDGEGQTHFAIKAGRTAKTANKISVKITASMDDPQGGDPLEFKGTLKIDQEHELSK